MVDFRCPACGFRVFNRAYPTCEGCSALLPSEFLFSKAEIARRKRAEVQRAEARIKKILAGPPGGESLPGKIGVILDI
jgi:hypothetical protein